jgi:hypothetical protein
MIDSIMYFGIGFLVAALLGLLFIPAVHNRATRVDHEAAGSVNAGLDY